MERKKTYTTSFKYRNSLRDKDEEDEMMEMIDKIRKETSIIMELYSAHEYLDSIIFDFTKDERR